MHKPLIYLASASPRRSALLTQIAVAHCVRPVAVDETCQPGESPDIYVQRLARTKAQALWSQLAEVERLPVLGADTTVALGSDVFGKPRDRTDAIAMLMQLSGATHQVYTAVALRDPSGMQCELSVSKVSFRELTAAECGAYWDSGEPRDKAGGYAIQGLGAVFVRAIEGSYSGIVGLPLYETAQLLARIGWRLSAPDGVSA